MVEHPANVTFGSKVKPPREGRAVSPNVIGNAAEQQRVPNFARANQAAAS